jgi:hypothetical protein
VFAGQTVGIKQTDDRIWLVSFMEPARDNVTSEPPIMDWNESSSFSIG